MAKENTAVTTKQNTLPAAVTTTNTFTALVRHMDSAIGERLPSGMDTGWFMRRLKDGFEHLMTTLREKNKSANFTRESVEAAITTAAFFGVDPAGSFNSAWFIPYGNQLQYQLGYNGLRTLVLNTGEFVSVDSQVVYEAEEDIVHIDLQSGEVRHPLVFSKRKGAVAGAYVVAERKDGRRIIDSMSIEELERARQNTLAWKSWPEEMYRKTVLKRGCKHLPMSNENKQRLDMAVRMDNAVEARYAVTEASSEAKAANIVQRLTGKPERTEEAAQDTEFTVPEETHTEQGQTLFDPPLCANAKCANMEETDSGSMAPKDASLCGVALSCPRVK
jgi:recombination protein RecT